MTTFAPAKRSPTSARPNDIDDMLFNSIQFLLFFPIVCLLYFCIPATRLRARNLLLLTTSYYFYMNWQPAYALLLLTSTAVTYLAALGIDRCKQRRHQRLCLVGSLVVNLGILFLFKYYNFAADNIEWALQACHLDLDLPEWELLLPVGISFYTFQALGYSIDVYRGDTAVERDFATYALFVSFFPQLVAGPIERSHRLLPQFKEQHHPDYDRMMGGLKLMAWGYFLKLALADRCGLYVDTVFNNVEMHNGGAYLIAALLFPFQIYGDFAGYSLIAIGVARVMGFRLMENFRRPYFACSVGEFWHRWHISLSTWFKDYVYIPLGGNRVGRARNHFNLLVTFVVSGIWHGANWTFFCWGSLHGLLLCAEKALGIGRQAYTGWRKTGHWAATFVLVCLAWVLFRANDMHDAMTILTGIVTRPALPDISFAMFTEITMALLALAIVATKEAADELGLHRHLPRRQAAVAGPLAIVAIATYLLLLGVLGGDQFIYFQF